MVDTTGTSLFKQEVTKLAANIRGIIASIGKFGANPDKVAQMAHALFGALLILVFKHFLIISHHGGFWGSVALLAWAVPKEAYLDPKFEAAPFWWDGAKDLFFYLVGAGLMLLALRLQLLLGRP